MNNVQYYLIHNLEEDRYQHMTNLFNKYGVEKEYIKFINHPNKNELTYKIKKSAVKKQSKIKDGWISCSYKHYLALEDIVKNKYQFSVIMEDNIGDFYEDVPTRLDNYNKKLPDDWGIVFDSIWGNYEMLNEEKLNKNNLVYKKSNLPTFDDRNRVISHGSTRAAQFYYIKLEAAKKLYENFLPFNHSADMWMNNLIRKNNINVYWSEPSLVTSKFNSQTSTNLKSKDFFYKIKSELINIILGI